MNTSPIQAAVDNAIAGDVICVASGNYTENVDITKQLTLRGEGADVVTVTAADSSDHVFEVTAERQRVIGRMLGFISTVRITATSLRITARTTAMASTAMASTWTLRATTRL